MGAGLWVCLPNCVPLPQGKPIDFVDVAEDNIKQWIADFTSKPISMPHRLENMDSKY